MQVKRANTTCVAFSRPSKAACRTKKVRKKIFRVTGPPACTFAPLPTTPNPACIARAHGERQTSYELIKTRKKGTYKNLSWRIVQTAHVTQTE
jgi:hypothetical protein